MHSICRFSSVLGGTHLSLPLQYNPANQARVETIDNQSFVWNGQPTSNVNTAYASNGLNQITSANSSNFTYDTNGNLTSDGTTNYVYDVENRLVSVSGGNTATLRYDPFGRLYEVTDSGGGKRRHYYDGDALIAEYNSSGTMLDRYIHGLGAGDDPLVSYAGSGTSLSNARFLYGDMRGSIVMQTDQLGGNVRITNYDEYGVHGTNAPERFGYTGQAWVPEAGLYYYKARMYSPSLGRFMQTDPIGYADGMNLYRYAANNPVNFVDPMGFCGYAVIQEMVRVGGSWRRNDGDGDGRPDGPYIERGGICPPSQNAVSIPRHAPGGEGGTGNRNVVAGERPGDGGSTGGAGAEGGWITEGDEVDEAGVPVIVVQAMTTPTLVDMPRYKVVFGYPNEAGHFTRHLRDYGLTFSQIQSIRRKITGHVQVSFDGPRRYSINYGGQTYLYGAFEVRPGLINVGSIYRP